MSLPTDGFGILAYLALIVPGIIFIMVRSQLRGFRDVDRSVGARILLAFVVSAIFVALYTAILGPRAVARLQSGAEVTPDEVAGAAWLFILTAILIPAVVSWAIYGETALLRPIHRAANTIKARITNSRYEPTPTAWDLATTTTEATWVRVRLNDGVWVGGRFGDRSYFSTYPEPRDLFIEEQYIMSGEGAFVDPVPSSAGVWVAVKDDYLVEWLHDAED
ncbi:DUF6338 family protein [Microbacterium pumilum]|uniref:DUF5671 domain-containing protein n=1 Tax=Microbacterium pumilum TaxID=344165 RepID=A0ABN2S3P5_9MICO